jgi:hypothetical protein
MRRLGSRPRLGDSRGAAAVEFAIVVPVLLLILFAILEFAFFMRDYLSVSSMTRVAARTASGGADAGSAECPPTMVGCRPGDVPTLATAAYSAVQRSGNAMDLSQVEEMWVFKANADGFPGTATTVEQMMADQCITNPSADLRCIKFQQVGGQLVPTAGAWDYNSIDACIDGPDAVGIYIRAQHPFLSGFFGTGATIQDRAVMAFEPLSAETCQPGSR